MAIEEKIKYFLNPKNSEIIQGIKKLRTFINKKDLEICEHILIPILKYVDESINKIESSNPLNPHYTGKRDKSFVNCIDELLSNGEGEGWKKLKLYMKLGSQHYSVTSGNAYISLTSFLPVYYAMTASSQDERAACGVFGLGVIILMKSALYSHQSAMGIHMEENFARLSEKSRQNMLTELNQGDISYLRKIANTPSTKLKENDHLLVNSNN